MADAPASGAGGRKVVKVQVLSFAQIFSHEFAAVVHVAAPCVPPQHRARAFPSAASRERSLRRLRFSLVLWFAFEYYQFVFGRCSCTVWPMKHWFLLATMIALPVLFLVSQGLAQGYGTTPVPERAYLCFEGHDANDIMTRSNELGARGWKMVTAASHGSTSVWCFEQYQASRKPAQPERR